MMISKFSLKVFLAMAVITSVFSDYIVYCDDVRDQGGDVPEIYAGLPPQRTIPLSKCNLKIETGMAFMDVETTGIKKSTSRIIEIVIYTSDGIFSTLVNPQVAINPKITEITGIADKDVVSAPIFPEIAEQVYSILEGKTIVGHNVSFDIGMVETELKRCGMELGKPKSICTLKAERKHHGKKGNSLSECLERHNISIEGFHRAGVDVEGTVLLYNSQLAKGYYNEDDAEKSKCAKGKGKNKGKGKDKVDSERKTEAVAAPEGAKEEERK